MVWGQPPCVWLDFFCSAQFLFMLGLQGFPGDVFGVQWTLQSGLLLQRGLCSEVALEAT